jgi:hypothetical protein
MSIEILEHGGRVETAVTELTFWYVGHHGNWGFSFPCDPQGNVDIASLNPTAQGNYQKCLTKTMQPPVEAPEIVHNTVIGRQSRIGRCHCGSMICLDNFTNSCDHCGRDYNSSGQELGSREFWGEETGERPSDCI